MPESPGQTPYKELVLPQNLSPLQLLAEGRVSSSSKPDSFSTGSDRNSSMASKMKDRKVRAPRALWHFEGLNYC